MFLGVWPSALAATLMTVTPWGGPPLRAQARLGIAAPIEDPTGNLAPRFRSLFAEAGTRLVRLSFWGTSHTASDQYTSVLRDRLQRRFGDGGAGAFLPAIPMTFYDRRDVIFETAAGFVGVSTRRTRGTLALGALGMALDARRAATARVRVRHPAVGIARLWVAGLGPERGRVALAIGARRVGRDVELGETALLELPLSHCPSETAAAEACASEVQSSIDVEAHHARVVALSTEASRGVVVESFGVSGARAAVTARWEETSFREQLSARSPDAVFLEYGTNESVGSTAISDHREALVALIARFRRAAPNALCVVIGPSNHPQSRGGRWYSNRHDLAVRDGYREVAFASGCGFFDLIAFEGGPTDMEAWVASAYALGDHVHLTDAGHQRLGEVLDAALQGRP